MNDEFILSLIRGLNANKSNGSDGISPCMILMCDESVEFPIQIIFSNILFTSVYPDMWKLVNLTSIFKKNNMQLIKYYTAISPLPICRRIFEKIVFKHMYNHLNSLNLISNNQSDFRPGDPTTNQIIDLVNEFTNPLTTGSLLKFEQYF